VCALDLDGVVTFLNPAAVALLAVGGAADGTSPIVEVGGRAPDFLLAPARRALRAGHVVHDDDALFPRSGDDRFPVAVVASPIVEHRQARGAVVAFQDITDRKAAEEQLARQGFYFAKPMPEPDATALFLTQFGPAQETPEAGLARAA
jgi:PAS domain-containing protein